MVKRLSLVIIPLVILIGFVLYRGYKTKNAALPVAFGPVAVPIPTPGLHKEENVVSPDMKQTLVVKEHQDQDLVTHTFWTLSEEDSAPKQIFTRTVDLSQTITIPFNTWSPGNKYLFLKESNGGHDSYVVLRSIGEAIAKDLETVRVEDLFTRKYMNYKITDVTGWAAPTLLIVNTDKVDGGVGPSFWFDVSTLAFTQLSTRFN